MELNPNKCELQIPQAPKFQILPFLAYSEPSVEKLEIREFWEGTKCRNSPILQTFRHKKGAHQKRHFYKF